MILLSVLYYSAEMSIVYYWYYSMIYLFRSIDWWSIYLLSLFWPVFNPVSNVVFNDIDIDDYCDYSSDSSDVVLCVPLSVIIVYWLFDDCVIEVMMILLLIHSTIIYSLTRYWPMTIGTSLIIDIPVIFSIHD